MTGKKIAVGICGASGMPYARRLMEVLAESGASVYASASSAAKPIFKSELGIEFQDFANALSQKFPSVKFFDDFDFSAPIASGSFYFDAMAICPCSMKTLSRIATATGDNLICRAADVALKERRKLVLVARETPLSLIHLRNMVSVTEAGAVVLPACPAFYFKENTVKELVDFVVARTLSAMGIKQNLTAQWGEKYQ
ncbi:UbiX family flavin prenyltransferase [Intestinicryptomonas porci]|uniref:Flavin prenyltransferase UbiX n=1 Tax=Intestinicryptomonas porci TaxID=2926320 RepID=A0ABU4WIR6_9BACT|nr:UbiX family flavin prenyltransferase [Opitutales bacterium CLA-KB-P66]